MKRANKKIHVIKNMDDIYRIVTVKNIDNLSKDIRAYLEFFVNTKQKLKDKGIDPLILKDHSMKWKNDGINKITKVEIV